MAPIFGGRSVTLADVSPEDWQVFLEDANASVGEALDALVDGYPHLALELLKALRDAVQEKLNHNPGDC